MSDDTIKIYTIKDLSEYCNCSKQTIMKHTEKLHLVNTYTTVNGKNVKAYELDSEQLNKIYNIIKDNKLTVNTIPTINNLLLSQEQPQEDWQKKYYETKSMLDVQLNQVKLITDREAEALKVNKELNKEISSKAEEIGKLEATCTMYQAQNSLKNKIILTLSSFITIGVVALIVKLILL